MISVYFQRQHWDLPEPPSPGYSTRYPSHLKVCPQCLVNWAVVMREVDRQELDVLAAFCEACGGGSLLSTTNWLLTDWELLQALPEPLLRREFELHLKTFQ